MPKARIQEKQRQYCQYSIAETSTVAFIYYSNNQCIHGKIKIVTTVHMRVLVIMYALNFIADQSNGCRDAMITCANCVAMRKPITFYLCIYIEHSMSHIMKGKPFNSILIFTKFPRHSAKNAYIILSYITLQ